MAVYTSWNTSLNCNMRLSTHKKLSTHCPKGWKDIEIDYSIFLGLIAIFQRYSHHVFFVEKSVALLMIERQMTEAISRQIMCHSVHQNVLSFWKGALSTSFSRRSQFSWHICPDEAKTLIFLDFEDRFQLTILFDINNIFQEPDVEFRKRPEPSFREILTHFLVSCQDPWSDFIPTFDLPG